MNMIRTISFHPHWLRKLVCVCVRDFVLVTNAMISSFLSRLEFTDWCIYLVLIIFWCGSYRKLSGIIDAQQRFNDRCDNLCIHNSFHIYFVLISIDIFLLLFCSLTNCFIVYNKSRSIYNLKTWATWRRKNSCRLNKKDKDFFNIVWKPLVFSWPNLIRLITQLRYANFYW